MSDAPKPQHCDENAANLAMICRSAMAACAPQDRVHFIETLIADLTETRDDLIKQQEHPCPHDA